MCGSEISAQIPMHKSTYIPLLKRYIYYVDLYIGVRADISEPHLIDWKIKKYYCEISET